MTETSGLLPDGFADLERFVALWGGASSTDERYAKRAGATMTELRALYDAITPRLEAIFDHLDRTPYGEKLPEAEARLYRLALAGAEAASAVEVFHQPDVPFRAARHLVRAPWSDEAR